jgi:hypothetical protein
VSEYFALGVVPEDVRDARRYRWLREQQYSDDVDLKFMDHNEDGPTGTWYSQWGDKLDAAIDAALAASPVAGKVKP